jgi:hypothetical protein
MKLVKRPTARSHRLASLISGIGLTLATVVGTGAAPAAAATTCDPGGDVCVVTPDTVQTPLGLVTVTVSADKVVTVELDATSSTTLVIGVPFAVPAVPVASCPGACSTATIDTAGGQVTVDTIQVPPGPPGRVALPSLAIIALHPPGPCRVRVTGTTVVFTPIQTGP